MQRTPHIRLIPRENLAQKAVGFNQYFPNQLILPREGQGKHKVLETDMSIWARYSKTCQNSPLPPAAVYFPEALDAFILGSKTGIKKLHQQLHCVGTQSSFSQSPPRLQFTHFQECTSGQGTFLFHQLHSKQLSGKSFSCFSHPHRRNSRKEYCSCRRSSKEITL